jgi:hypothetical protein
LCAHVLHAKGTRDATGYPQHPANQENAMSKTIRRTRAGLLALAVTGALGFGATAALAGPTPCPRLAIGKCTNLTQCQNQCAQAGGDVSGARCETNGGSGCCYCPIF